MSRRHILDMPKVSLASEDVSLDGVRAAIQQSLGERYKIEPFVGATLLVRKSWFIRAKVQLVRRLSGTDVLITGRGGPVLWPTNHVGIARQLAHAVASAYQQP